MPARLTDSKTFWAVSALTSLSILGASAWSLYGRVSLHFSEDMVSISPKPVPLPGAGEEEKEHEAGPEVKAPGNEQPGRPEERTANAAPARARAVKTVFEYRGAGKKVSVAGSFSVWRELPMSRRDGAWRTEAYIFPGTYTYHFMVDGIKTADPGKPKARTGDSIVTVE